MRSCPTHNASWQLVKKIENVFVYFFRMSHFESLINVTAYCRAPILARACTSHISRACIFRSSLTTYCLCGHPVDRALNPILYCCVCSKEMWFMFSISAWSVIHFAHLKLWFHFCALDLHACSAEQKEILARNRQICPSVSLIKRLASYKLCLWAPSFVLTVSIFLSHKTVIKQHFEPR